MVLSVRWGVCELDHRPDVPSAVGGSKAVAKRSHGTRKLLRSGVARGASAPETRRSQLNKPL